MNFLEAVKTCRPIRRRTIACFRGPWIVIGERRLLGEVQHPWRRIDTGEEITLAIFDYTATDWEVQPCEHAQLPSIDVDELAVLRSSRTLLAGLLASGALSGFPEQELLARELLK